MKEYTVTASVKGQIVIPAPLREKFSIQAGTRILVEDGGDRIVLIPITAAMVKRLRGSLKGKGAIIQLLEARRQDKALDA